MIAAMHATWMRSLSRKRTFFYDTRQDPNLLGKLLAEGKTKQIYAYPDDELGLYGRQRSDYGG